ncbi:XRE family transcriptional regulator [Streptomyces sp. NPDC004680]|uniref:XRE family transcriptional regulator n=1 Tax=Streptomyces sp. NPDC004680 TaxID=3154287 RepID=UPI0033A70B69
MRVAVAQHAKGLRPGSLGCEPSRVRGTAGHGPLGAALRKARKRAGLSLREAADGTGISYSTLSRVENGLVPMPSLEAAAAVARNVGLDEREALRLGGRLVPPGFAELADPGLKRAVRGGRLSPAAVGALRQVHLRELASEFSAGLGAGRPVNIRLAAKLLGLGLVASCRQEAGFAADGMSYRIPAAADHSHVAQRIWSAHGLAHKLIADDAGAAPGCRPQERGSAEEREAAYVASRILVPPALLAAELRQSPLPPSDSPPAFIAALERVASRFRVPADWAAARLAEDRIGELSW